MATLELISTRGVYGTATDRIVAIATRGFWDELEAVTLQRIISYLLSDRYDADALAFKYSCYVEKDKYSAGDTGC